MRRTIVIAIAVGLLFAGGCGRADRRADRDQPPASVSTQQTPPAATGQKAQQQTGQAGQSADDVDHLLDQVDTQLSGDAQPADDDD